jgi:hypothetical protein
MAVPIKIVTQEGEAMELDWGTAIAGAVQFAIGLGFYELAQYVSRRIKGNTGKVLSWPCYGVAFIFLGSAVFTILWNMFGPAVLWLVSWF